jgi:hypothetical protein
MNVVFSHKALFEQSVSGSQRAVALSSMILQRRLFGFRCELTIKAL